MNEQLHYFSTNYHLAVPATVFLTMGFLYWQKRTIKNKNTDIIDSTFILRNSLFVGVVALFLIYFNKPLPSLEESLLVTPAEF
jgi:type IV secretory pathway TrbL component